MIILIVLLTFSGIALGVMSIYWLFARPDERCQCSAWKARIPHWRL